MRHNHNEIHIGGVKMGATGGGGGAIVKGGWGKAADFQTNVKTTLKLFILLWTAFF
jgi:hypothetical protein